MIGYRVPVFVLNIFKRCCSTAHPIKVNKAKAKSDLSKIFIDYKRVRVTGGSGGNGAMSFMSMPRKEFAGPDGGDGGNGGHIIFEAKEGKRCLAHISSILCGEHGTKGQSSHCHGKNAKHNIVHVPVGTLVKDEQGNCLTDLDHEGHFIVAARGGGGGHGNHFFLSNENRVPTVYEKGAEGESLVLQLELRVMAHVGLVGFPNAGKSTLLRAISRARPKVAAYPFTTLNPTVGMVEYEDYEQLAVADIPGLIKGAHMNYGLGFSFLRHIERCNCLIYVLDLAQDKPWTQLQDLMFELDQYQPGLSQRPCAIVANKIDLPIAKENLNLLQEKVPDSKIFPISAKYKEHTHELLVHIRTLYDDLRNKESSAKL